MVIGAILWSFIPKCEGDKVINTDPIKAKIKQEVKTKDSVEKVVKVNDSIRIKYIVKWRKLKADTVYLPCDSMLTKVIHICDTIIKIDSTEIANMRKVIIVDDIIISDQNKVIVNDSIEIVGLNKQVKKQKRKTKWALAVAGIFGVVAISK